MDNSSEVLKFFAITYSNEYKIKMGVDSGIIEKYSVYSFEVSRQMSKIISDFTKSTYAVGITGKTNKIDSNNLSKNDNKIFISIYNSKTKKYEDLLLTCPNKKREECKKYITNKILEKLLTI